MKRSQSRIDISPQAETRSFVAERIVPNQLTEVAKARDWLRSVVEQSGAPISDHGVWQSSVALTEALNNAIFHAHKNKKNEIIKVTILIEVRTITITVIDRGPKFFLPPYVTPAVDKMSGRGLFIIQTYCQHVQLARKSDSNVLTMVYDDTASDQFDRMSLQALHRLSQAIIDAPKFSVICELILQELVEIIPVVRASIMQYDPLEKNLKVVAAIGISDRVARGVRVSVGEGVSGEVFATSQPLLVKDTREYSRASQRSGYRGQSLIAVPIITRSTDEDAPPIGVINMTDKKDGTSFDERDLMLLQTVSNQAAVYMRLTAMADELATAHVVAQELAIAREIQQGLLPSSPQEFPGLSTAGVCLPAARVGGDYFDYFTDAQGLPTVVIADVAGHDVAAALTMAGLRTLLRAELSRPYESLANVMTRLNEHLYADLERAERFISCVLLHYDRKLRIVRYCVAGHPPLVVRHSTGRVHNLPAGEGGLLGISPDMFYEVREAKVEKGDIVFVYTDGLTGVRNPKGKQYGISRLRKTLSENAQFSPRKIVANIQSKVLEFAGSEPIGDDITLMSMKAK